MIKIKKSTQADSRTMLGEPIKEDLLNASKQHIEDVQKGCKYFSDKLLEVGKNHYHTKIEDIDQFFEDYSAKLGNGFKKAKWYQKHLTERHHLSDKCPDDVNLLDVLERVIDITMAGMGRSGVIYYTDISNEILQKAYKNTIELLKNEIIVEE